MPYNYGSVSTKQKDPYGSKPMPMEYRAGMGGTPPVKHEFTCDKCGASFDARIALVGHMRKHKNEQDQG